MLDELVVDKDEERLEMKKRYLRCDLLILDDWLLESPRDGTAAARVQHGKGAR